MAFSTLEPRRDGREGAGRDQLSKSLFQRRVERMDKGVLHKAWRGWLLVQLGFQKKKNILARAVNKLRRRKLALAFNEWASHHGRAKKVGGMGGAARQVVINGMRRRTFRAWREKAADSRRQMVMAGNTAKLREEFLERLVEVGLRQLVHKRMRKAWTGFDQFSEVRRGRRNRMRQAIARATKGRLSRAFQSWDEQATLRRKQRGMVRRAIQRMRKGTLARCFDKWREADRHKKRCLMRLAKGKQARAFARWQSNMALLRRAGIAFDRWADRNRVNAFRGWAAAADQKREQTRLCEQILKRMLMRGVRNAWKQWCWVVEDATGCSLDHVRALKDALGWRVNGASFASWTAASGAAGGWRSPRRLAGCFATSGGSSSSSSRTSRRRRRVSCATPSRRRRRRGGSRTGSSAATSSSATR